MRGTAILASNEMPNTIVHKLLSGRVMKAEYNGISLFNVYAPSGSTRRINRENFYNTELPSSSIPPPTTRSSEGIYVLNSADTTGPFQLSRALAEIVSRLALVDI